MSTTPPNPGDVECNHFCPVTAYTVHPEAAHYLDCTIWPTVSRGMIPPHARPTAPAQRPAPAPTDHRAPSADMWGGYVVAACCSAVVIVAFLLLGAVFLGWQLP
jgi:hypothetical protein